MGRQVAPLAADVEPHGQPGGPGVGDERVELREAGHGMVRRLLVDAAQDPEGRAHLAQQLLAGLLDRRQRRARLLRVVVHEVERHSRLHVDQRDVVAEHVVQLLRDPQPFLHALAALGLLPGRTRLGEPLATGPESLRRRAHGDEPGERRGRRPPRRARIADEADDDRAGVDGPDHRVGGDTVPGADRRDECDHRRQVHRPVGVAEREVGDEHRPHHTEHDRWVPPAHHQRQRPREHQRHRHRVGGASGLVVGGERRAGHPEHRDGGGQRQRRARAAPPAGKR